LQSDTIKVTNSFFNSKQTTIYLKDPESATTPKLHLKQHSLTTRSTDQNYRFENSVLTDPGEKKRIRKLALEHIAKYVPKQPKRLNEISERFRALHASIPKTLEEEILDEAPSLFRNKQEIPIEQDPLGDQIKFVSAIDCKPVRPPYLKLMPL
jgi:hypothetical protein